VDNQTIAQHLRQHALDLEGEGGNVYRARAYRQAAGAVQMATRPLADLLQERGRRGLEEVPGIGTSLAITIERLIRTGVFEPVMPADGHRRPERLVTGLPGIGVAVAARLRDHLGVIDVPGLEAALRQGKLAQVGLGPRQVQRIHDALAQRSIPPRPPADEPSVADLLALDREYREKDREQRLPRITPRDFNEGHEAWLPVLGAQRNGWHLRVLYSNTALAHRLGKTRDWVVIYFHDGIRSGQRTVVTETRGDLAGQRVVRGREGECQLQSTPAA
jgi:hypothetical protein